MSTRADIITALDTRLKTILVSNGYNTNLGASVHHWQTQNIPEDSCPFLVYRDQTSTERFATTKKTEHRIPVEIDLKYAVTSIAAVFEGMEDVLGVLGTDDTLGGLLESMAPMGTELTPDVSAQTIIVSAQITIELTYWSNKWEL